MIVAVPVVEAEKLALQWSCPLGGMQPKGVNVPVTPVTLNVIVPVGVDAPETPVSNASASQSRVWPTAMISGWHSNMVRVVLVPVTVTVTPILVLVAWVESPP